MRAVLEAAPAGAANRAVLMAVMLHVGSNGEPCTASVKTLADLAGVSLRHARRALAELVPDYLDREDVPGAGTRLTPRTPVSALPRTPASGPPRTPVVPRTPASPRTPVSAKGEEQRARAQSDDDSTAIRQLLERELAALTVAPRSSEIDTSRVSQSNDLRLTDPMTRERIHA